MRAFNLTALTAGREPQAGTSGGRRVDNGVLVVCGLAWACGLIHIQAAIDHLDEYWLYALFFIALAVAQFLWGAMLYRSPRRGVLVAGAVGSMAVVALWVVSRTSGLPIGPEPGTPESVGVLDAVASADELVTTLLVGLYLRPLGTGRLARSADFTVRAAAVVLILLSSLTLAGGAHAH